MTADKKRLIALSAAVLISLGGCASNTEISVPRSRTRNITVEDTEDLTVKASELTEADMLKPSGELGSFSTKFNPKQKGRSSNIKRASDSINSVVVNPGETFSYNETIGPTSRKNGYKLGTIFVKGEMFEGYGGGVCQVSSTLYNAAANAGMTIVERHDHSRPVPYVEKGKDAATSYGGVDFKFKNEKLLELALTQSGADAINNNERLEFIGDRVLGLSVAALLYEMFADESEGELARRHAALVSTETLSDVAQKLGLDKRVRRGHMTAGRIKHILANAMEAVLGAIYIDGGWDAARDFVLDIWRDLAASVATAPKDACWRRACMMV